jgi:ring-1,2-phenylacetyl-CoA epoxidase subunit PaaD
MMNEEQIISILSEVKDPEIPVISIAELGILRGVDIYGERIQVHITPTYSGCPAMETIQEDIRSALSKHGIHEVEIEQSLSPAWTTEWMSETGKQKLKDYGIAPPAPKGCSLQGNDRPESCPHCHSEKIELISQFGSTSCKAIYRCLDCKEVFDYFKCH